MRQNTNPEELAIFLNSRPDDLVEMPMARQSEEIVEESGVVEEVEENRDPEEVEES